MSQLNIDRWRTHHQKFAFDDLTIFAKDSVEEFNNGELPVLLLVHGFPTSSIDWQPIWSRINKKFRCITLDLIGFGDSDKPLGRPITIIQQSELCLAFLKSKNISSFHMLCHDYGVSIGQEILAKAKESESFTPLSCIFLNGGLFPEVHRAKFIQKLLISPLGPWVAKLMSYPSFKRTMSDICTQPIDEGDLLLYWQLLEQNQGRKILPALIRYMEQRRQHATRWGDAADDPPCDTLLINGVDDPISGGHMADRYEQRVKQPKVVRLDNVGHYPQVEAPERVMDAAENFWHTCNSSIG